MDISPEWEQGFLAGLAIGSTNGVYSGGVVVPASQTITYAVNLISSAQGVTLGDCQSTLINPLLATVSLLLDATINTSCMSIGVPVITLG